MHLSYHHGIGLLAAVAKQYGAEVVVYQVHDDLAHPPDAEKCAMEISSLHADFICISTSSLEWGFAKMLAAELSKFSNAKIIVGGPHLTFSNSNDGFDLFDRVVVGEGENFIRDLANGELCAGKIVHGELITDLNLLPFSDRESFEMKKIIAARHGIIDFITQRGCPYSCSFCSNHALRKMYGKKYLRRRSVENVIEEIKEVIGRYQCKMIFFHDDIFTLNESWVEEFCGRYAKEIGVPWMINSHINHMGNKIIKFLAEAGCIEVKLGIESGDERIRNKVLNKRVSNNEIKECFEAVRKAGLRTFAFIMHGVPEETETSYEKSVQLMAEIKPNVIRSTIFFPLPNTVLGDPFFRTNGKLDASMLGDTPASPLTHGAETLSMFYMFGWKINFLLGFKEYRKLLKKYFGSANVAELKQADAIMSKELSSQGKTHYRFGNECSMLKLEDGKNPF